MEELRWLLLILGLLVIVLVYGYGRVQQWRNEGPPWRRRRTEPDPFAEDSLLNEDVEESLSELNSLISERQEELRGPHWPGESMAADERSVARTNRGNDEVGVPEQPGSQRSERREGRLAALFGSRARNPQPQVKREPEGKPTSPDEEKIVVINLVAVAEGGFFSGPELVQALEAAGMHLGEHKIFHRLLDTPSDPSTLFSAANILEPGWFDMAQIASFETPGVVFFMRLPGPYDGLVTFEQMLATAREVAERLGGHLLDGRRCDLTQQAIEHIREDLLEYRRRAHLAARQAR
ncbi:MAG: cell division protein ZipA [Nitrococcus sp.]|nr:cell division protein ZipA [Nitrococcus sp.]